MLVARWQIDARFGHKDEVLRGLKRWVEEVGSRAGFPVSRFRILTGSVGALESTFVCEIEVDSLEELEAGWAKMSEIPAHREWSRRLEPDVVSGTQRWEIYRVLS